MSFLGGSINSQTLNGIESITDGYITIQDGTISNLQELSIGGDVTVGTNLYVGGKITCAYTATLNTDVPNKLYVDLGLSSLNTSQFLKLDGSTPMTGGLIMGGNYINGLPTATNPSDATNKSYVDAGDATNKSYCDTNDALRLLKAGDTMTGTLNMGPTTQNKIINLLAGTDLLDGVNKSQMDAADNLRLLKSGGTMTGTLDMGPTTQNKIINLLAGTNSLDGVNKSQMDAADNLRLKLDGTSIMGGQLNMNANTLNNCPNLNAGATMNFKIGNVTVMNTLATGLVLSQPINMSGSTILNLATTTISTSAVNKAQMDSADALRLLKAGDTMTGTLNMSGNTILNLATTAISTSAVNKAQMDAADALNLKLDGTTPMMSDLNMNTHMISNLSTATPTANQAISLVYFQNTVNDVVANYLPLSGGTLSNTLTFSGGELNMNGKNISNVNIINSPATTPLYISNNNVANCIFNTTGLVMSTARNINMNGNYINFLQGSITAGDAVNRGEIANSLIPLISWRSGDTIQTVLNGTSLGQVLYNSYIYGGVTGSLAAANVNSIFYALSFTPKSTSSIIYATFDGSATMAGGDTDSFKCYVAKYVGTTTTNYMMHNTYTTGAGGMRGTSVLPITACWNNTTLTAYTIGCYFDTQGADDTITFNDKFNVRIQEIKI